MKRTVLIAAILLSALAPAMALADDDDCKVPMAQWQPREAVEQMAKAHGWTVRRIKIDDGCYEIKGRDENSREIEVRVDPGSLAVIRMKHKSGHDDSDDGRRGSVQEPPRPSDAAPPASGLLKGTTPPKVEIK
ncbi:MAG: PepSY domain-containing protein [Reyranella sp.]|uniref:PepSY domain-containing protein n=1 Tax=Reyranella sp. TaxID=1929291 RepID=UPI003D0A7BCE